MTPSETAEIIGTLKIFWPNHPTPDVEKIIAAWHAVIGDIPYEQMQAAVTTYMRSGSAFFPMPGQLIALIAAQQYDDLIPDVIWPEIKREIRRHPHGVKTVAEKNAEGFWKTVPNPGPSFSHPLIQAAVDGIGWETICAHTDEQDMQKTFFFTLRELKARAVAQAQRAPVDEPVPAVEAGSGVYALNGNGTSR